MSLKVCSSCGDQSMEPNWIAIHGICQFLCWDLSDGLVDSQHQRRNVWKPDPMHKLLDFVEDPVVAGRNVQQVSRVRNQLNVVVSQLVDSVIHMIHRCSIMQKSPVDLVVPQEWPAMSERLAEVLQNGQINMSVDPCSIWHPLYEHGLQS